MNREALTTPALEALLQAPSLAILAVDKQGCVILWSPSASRMFGWSESEVLGRFLPIVPEERRQEVCDRIQAELKGETFGPLDVPAIRKDGSLVDVSLWTVPLRDSKGEVIGMLGLHVDITARKQAEQALGQTQTELQRVLASVSDYLWSGEFDPDGRFSYRYYSPAVERITGRPAEFYLAGPERWLSTIHPEDRPRLVATLGRLQMGHSTREEEEYRLMLPDGTIRWVRDSVTVSQSANGHRHLNGVVSDITARRQTEEALRESQLELRQVLGAASDYFWSGDIDPEGRFRYRYYSPAVERITGRPAEFYMAGSERWMSTVHPEDRARVAEISERQLSGQLVSCENDHRIVLPDGTIRWVRSKVTVAPSAEGHRRVDGVVSDITARKESEEALGRAHDELEERVRERTAELAESNVALRNSEAKYRTLVEQIPAITYTTAWDETYTTMYVSPQIEAVLGFTPAEVTATPDFWPQHMHPDDYQRIITEAERAFACGKPFDGEYRIPNRKGEIVWVRDRAAVIRDEAGKPLFLQGVLLDVTERRRIEETMRLQSAALEAAANSIVLTDREGHILWANPAFAKLTGYKLSEVIGKNPRVLKSGQHDKAFYKNLWQTVLSGRVWHGEIINKRKDGSLYAEEMTITPVRNAAGKITHFIAIKQDITEWKSAEESQRYLAAIVTSSDDAIVSADFDGTITSWNAGAERLYGYAPEEIVGRPVAILVPRNRIGEMREILKKVQCGEYIQHFETVRLKKGGIPVDVSITLSPIKNDTGQVIGISAITHDVTERNELEQAVVEASSREQRRIGLDLHDGLCQQLTGIGFLWKVIAQSEVGRALPKAAEVAEISQLITKTIGDARDLARGLCPVEVESNDLGVALKNLGLSTERLFAVSCVVRCQQAVSLADKTVATHLYRIAQEAISNAIRHGKAARVWIHLIWRKNGLTLRIRDNGSGFSKRRGFKEGIGMRSMKYRAQAIGGSLTIESKRGVGTTVACVYSQPRSRLAGEARRRPPR